MPYETAIMTGRRGHHIWIILYYCGRVEGVDNDNLRMTADLLCALSYILMLGMTFLFVIGGLAVETTVIRQRL